MQLRGTDIVVDKVRSKRNIISGSGATASLSEFDSGSLVLMDRAAGIVFTLPAACAIGTNYNFMVTTSVTTNAYKVITGAGTELLIGGYTSVDTDSSNATAVFTANGSTHIALNMTAAASNALGGLQGTSIKFHKLSSTQWEVTGMVMCGGTPASAFATS
jgi:hypothetical protein